MAAESRAHASEPLPRITLVGVEKALGGKPVLRGVDLAIPAGQLTTLIGRSGEGKTVLLKHMIGLMQPDRGEVWLDGVEISRLKGKRLDEVRTRFAMVFQGAALFDSLTVFENVAFPLRAWLGLPDREVAPRVQEVLDRVGLPGMEDKRPAKLSGGMKKRVGLARTLVIELGILLIDGPTTGLDPLTARRIHELIVTMHQVLGFTAVKVSHDIPEIIAISDWLAMVGDGRIAAMAAPAVFQRTADRGIREFMMAA